MRGLLGADAGWRNPPSIEPGGPVHNVAVSPGVRVTSANAAMSAGWAGGDLDAKHPELGSAARNSISVAW